MDALIQAIDKYDPVASPKPEGVAKPLKRMTKEMVTPPRTRKRRRYSETLESKSPLDKSVSILRLHPNSGENKAHSSLDLFADRMLKLVPFRNDRERTYVRKIIAAAIKLVESINISTQTHMLFVEIEPDVVCALLRVKRAYKDLEQICTHLIDAITVRACKLRAQIMHTVLKQADTFVAERQARLEHALTQDATLATKHSQRVLIESLLPGATAATLMAVKRLRVEDDNLLLALTVKPLFRHEDTYLRRVCNSWLVEQIRKMLQAYMKRKGLDDRFFSCNGQICTVLGSNPHLFQMQGALAEPFNPYAPFTPADTQQEMYENDLKSAKTARKWLYTKFLAELNCLANQQHPLHDPKEQQECCKKRMQLLPSCHDVHKKF